MEPCAKCGSTRKSGKTGRCLDCKKAADTAWRRANPEKARAASLKWNEAHPEQRKALNESWRKRNPERAKALTTTHNRSEKKKAINAAYNKANVKKVRAKSAAWHAANKERHNAMIAEWAKKNRERRKATITAWGQANKDQILTYAAKRRTKKAKAKGAHTTEQWLNLLASYHGKCVYCGAKATAREHIVPLDGGGTNDIENIAPACKPCNSSKGTKPLLVWLLTRHARTKQKEKK